MVAKITDYLNLYISKDGIPLKQVLAAEDINQIAVSLYHLTKNKEFKDFEAISNGLFSNLKDKSNNAVFYPIKSIPFLPINSDEEEIANIALLGYYCFMYFNVIHTLPVEKIIFVVNSFMSKHIINVQDIHKVNCNNPISNLVPINEEQYIRFNGKNIIPPFDEIKDNFIKEITNLLIK